MFEFLQTEALISQFREALAADPEFLQKKIRELFLNNPHRLAFTMTPDAAYNAVCIVVAIVGVDV